MNTKNVPLCLCLSVLCPLFFPSGYIYCFFTQSLFIKSLPPHLCVLFISSSSGQNRDDIFHIFSPRVVAALDKKSFVRARNNPFRQSYYIFLPDKYLRRYPSSRWSLVLLQGLVGTYSARLPPRHDVISVWLHEP